MAADDVGEVMETAVDELESVRTTGLNAEATRGWYDELNESRVSKWPPPPVSAN